MDSMEILFNIMHPFLIIVGKKSYILPPRFSTRVHLCYRSNEMPKEKLFSFFLYRRAKNNVSLITTSQLANTSFKANFSFQLQKLPKLSKGWISSDPFVSTFFQTNCRTNNENETKSKKKKTSVYLSTCHLTRNVKNVQLTTAKSCHYRM